MKTDSIVILIFWFSTSLSAQSTSVVQVNIDSVLRAYNEQTIYLDGNGKYLKDKKKYPMGFFNQKLKKELSASPEALTLYKTFVRKQWQGIGLMIVGLGAGLTLIVMANPVGYLFIIPYMVGAVHSINGTQFYYQSIWTFNRDMLMKALAK